MRSGTNSNINSGQVHSWALGLLIDAKLLKDHGWKCTTAIVLSITPRAAARCISITKLGTTDTLFTDNDFGLLKRGPTRHPFKDCQPDCAGLPLDRQLCGWHLFTPAQAESFSTF